MDAARWERIQVLFHEVADLPGPAQRAFLETECRDDPALMGEVLGLLEEDARGESLLDRDVANVAGQVLEQGIPPALLDQDFGPYRMQRMLGEGGMGVVYLAERADLGSVAAIKILRDAWLSPDRRERFASEQRTLAQLNHPAIARLYDASTLPDGTPWFVMEYVEGIPLTKFCEEHASAMPQRLRLFRAVCEAVEHAAGGSYVPSVSKRAWAELDVLCLTAMRKETERRYRTVEALIRDVDHYLAGEPLEARPDTLGYRLGKYVRRNWRPVSAAAASFIIVISLVVFYTVRLATARNAAVAEAARTQRIQRFMLNLFQGGDEAVGPADSLRVVTLVDRGVQDARSLDAEPAVQAELYQALGSIYQKLGKLDRADSLLRTALAQRRALFGSEHTEVAKSLVALGSLRVDQAEYKEAERLIREGLEMSKRQLRPGHPAIASATVALGQALEESGQYQEGIKVLEQAVRLRSAPGVTPTAELAASMRELANTHFYAGHLAVAEI